MGNFFCCCKKTKSDSLLIKRNKCLYCSYENKDLTKLNKHMKNCKYNYGKAYLTNPFVL